MTAFAPGSSLMFRSSGLVRGSAPSRARPRGRPRPAVRALRRPADRRDRRSRRARATRASVGTGVSRTSSRIEIVGDDLGHLDRRARAALGAALRGRHRDGEPGGDQARSGSRRRHASRGCRSEAAPPRASVAHRGSVGGTRADGGSDPALAASSRDVLARLGERDGRVIVSTAGPRCSECRSTSGGLNGLRGREDASAPLRVGGARCRFRIGAARVGASAAGSGATRLLGPEACASFGGRAGAAGAERPSTAGWVSAVIAAPSSPRRTRRRRRRATVERVAGTGGGSSAAAWIDGVRDVAVPNVLGVGPLPSASQPSSSIVGLRVGSDLMLPHRAAPVSRLAQWGRDTTPLNMRWVRVRASICSLHRGDVLLRDRLPRLVDDAARLVDRVAPEVARRDDLLDLREQPLDLADELLGLLLGRPRTPRSSGARPCSPWRSSIILLDLVPREAARRGDLDRLLLARLEVLGAAR